MPAQLPNPFSVLVWAPPPPCPTLYDLLFTLSCLPSSPSHTLEPSLAPSLHLLTSTHWQDLGLKLSEKELRDMIHDADRSSRGMGVGEEEYLHILKHSTWI